MSLKYKGISFPLTNLILIIKFTFNFIVLIFILRISSRKNCCSKSQLGEAFTCGPLVCLVLVLLLPSLVNMSLWIIGTLSWVILHFVLFVVFSLLTSFQLIQINLSKFVPHVERANFINHFVVSSVVSKYP